jgi:hypothetical protein
LPDDHAVSAMSKTDADLLSRVRGEIDARLSELRPHLEEYEQLQSAAAALGVPEQKPQSAPRRRRQASVRVPGGAKVRVPGGASVRVPGGAKVRVPGGATVRVPGGATQKRILDALEHGSHTVSELVVVTALSGPSVRQNLRRLMGSEAVTRAKRDGKAAYALASRARS